MGNVIEAAAVNVRPPGVGTSTATTRPAGSGLGATGSAAILRSSGAPSKTRHQETVAHVPAYPDGATHTENGAPLSLGVGRVTAPQAASGRAHKRFRLSALVVHAGGSLRTGVYILSSAHFSVLCRRE